MSFERFTKTGRGYKPKASVWSRGQIGFNQGAVEKFRIRDFKYAVLFYDLDTKKVGIKFTNDENEEGITKLTTRLTGASISARAFLDFYDIAHLETKKYDIEYDDENDLYVIELA